MAGARLKIAVGAAVLMVGGLAATAVAGDDDDDARARLQGFQEVPAVSTEGGGKFDASIDGSGEEVRWRLRYDDLSTSVQQAHIHFGQRSVNGGVAVFLCSNLGNGPAGTQECPDFGMVRGTFTADDVIGPAGQGIAAGEFDELLRALRAGKTYVNVHTDMFEGGEIRGQVHARHD